MYEPKSFRWCCGSCKDEEEEDEEESGDKTINECKTSVS